ncbi:WbqC family protein [Vibrio tasmaniensis]|uniref:WbqC family protein n=1 Tax=Vibrio tasmaniensis TaxID=212663 RepID=UPI00107F8F22|nr:WbqC family protein [Vibrio tasmaniensis]
MKTVAIMQPYFLPYVGYFALINAVDEFVVYDEIEYTKKGWINRNRVLSNGKPLVFSIPLRKDSSYLHVNKRFLSDDVDKFKTKLIRQVENNYRKAPYFTEGKKLLEDCLIFESKNLFDFIFYSIKKVNEYLGIETKITVSSSLNFNNDLKSQDKVIDIVKATGANCYINPIGGVELYDKDVFEHHNIELSFQKMNLKEYKQLDHEFIAGLSILDLVMFNSVSDIKLMFEDMALL